MLISPKTLEDAREIVRFGARANLRNSLPEIDTVPLYSSGIVYEPHEKPDKLLSYREMLEKKKADCEDLSAALLAKLWRRGESGADAMALNTPSGRVHVKIKRENGLEEDPSIALHPDVWGIGAAAIPYQNAWIIPYRNRRGEEHKIVGDIGFSPLLLAALLPSGAVPVIKKSSLAHTVLRNLRKGKKPVTKTGMEILRVLKKQARRVAEQGIDYGLDEILGSDSDSDIAAWDIPGLFGSGTLRAMLLASENIGIPLTEVEKGGPLTKAAFAYQVGLTKPIIDIRE